VCLQSHVKTNRLSFVIPTTCETLDIDIKYGTLETSLFLQD
jgi:hypothetical protein